MLSNLKHSPFMKSIKLNAKEENILNAKEMELIKGGEKCCGCACYYRNVGGSSIDDNMDANRLGGGLQSPQLTQDYVWITQDGKDRW